jgi:mRNA interferase MazF
MNLSFGDIVIIEFRFKDDSGHKKRPALVLSIDDDQDLILARVTSQPLNNSSDYEIKNWQSAFLLKPSIIKLNKLITINESLLYTKLGRLDSEEIQNLKEKIKGIISNNL